MHDIHMERLPRQSSALLLRSTSTCRSTRVFQSHIDTMSYKDSEIDALYQRYKSERYIMHLIGTE